MLRVMLLGTRTSSPTTQPLDPAGERLDDGVRLQAGQALAGAAVRAVAEGEVVDRVALDQEGVGVLVVARVAVAGAEEDRDLRAGRDTTPSISTSLVTQRPQAWTGAQKRSTSLKAAGTSDGFLRTSSNWSGWPPKSATMLPIAAIVVSTPAPRYWWMMCPAVSGGMSPRASASKMPRPTEPGARSSAVTGRAPAVELAGDREALGGALVHRADDLHRGLAPAQHVVADVAAEADEVGDDLSGKARARESMASKEPLRDELGDERVGLGVDCDLQAAQRPGGEVLGQRRAQLGVDRRVGGERGALQRLVDHRVEADRGRRERLRSRRARRG